MLTNAADTGPLGRANKVNCSPTGCPYKRQTQSDVTPAKADLRMRAELHYKLRKGSLSFFLNVGPALEYLANTGRIGYQ